jgi:hypothetical protein
MKRLFLALALAGALQARADISPTADAGLQAYCDKIAQVVESGRLKPRFFVDVTNKKGAHWREFKDQGVLDAACKEAACYQEAWAYYDQGRLILAAFTFGGAKADWANNVDYYFYPNGRVAKDHSELRRSGALDPLHPELPAFLVEVDRARYYDKQGKPLNVDPPQCFRVEGDTKQPIAGAKFAEGEWPRFKQVQDLPIAAFLRGPKAKPKAP